MTNEQNNPVQARLLQVFHSHEVQTCLRDVEAVAGYRLGGPERAPFLRFHARITADPPPKYILRWRASKELERWYHAHVNGILGHTQNALAGVCYHRDRLVGIEDGVLEVLSRYDYKTVLGDTTVALGNTLQWDFEYQAFILGTRRCLDYLARGLASYFQKEFHSFRRLPRFLASCTPRVVAESLAQVHERQAPRFAHVLSSGMGRSVRDRISHYEFVGAGSVHLNRLGFALVGGGEDLKPQWAGEAESLGTVVKRHTLALCDCIADFLDSIVKSATSAEAE